MCWLNSPRFVLDESDYELFGIETINRPLGGVFVGVNKAVGKHHWEVFNDEGRDSRIDELTTTTLRAQTEAAGDFDIEWANNPGNFIWQQRKLQEFRQWLTDNHFNPDDKSLTIGHPQIGQVDLESSFHTENYEIIWKLLEQRLNVCSIRTSDAQAEYDYNWDDADYMQQQIRALS
jgi:PKD repeat protein